MVIYLNITSKTSEKDRNIVEFGLCNLSLEFSLTHVVVAESSFG